MIHKTTSSKSSRSQTRHAAILAIGVLAAFGLAGGTAAAQSIIGDEFDWQRGDGVGFGESGSVGAFSLGNFSTLNVSGNILSMSFEPTAIIITTDFFQDPDASITLGTLQDGTDLRFRLTGIDFNNGDGIGGIQISGTTNATIDDISFTGDSITIGSGVPGEPVEFVDGDTLRIDLVPDSCGSDSILNPRTGDRFSSIQAAIDAATDGDVIELGQCVYAEGGIVADGRTITIRGTERRVTEFGGSSFEPVLSVRSGAVVTLEDLTIGIGINSSGPAAIAIEGPDDAVTLRNVRVSSNFGPGGAIEVRGSLLADRSEFRDNGGGRGGSLQVRAGGTARVTNSLFVGNGNAVSQLSIETNESSATAFIANCTFTGPSDNAHISVVGSGADMSVTNSIFTADTPVSLAQNGASVTVANSIVPSPTAGIGNVIGTPVFVDAANSDFRLVSGSPGIDVGDLHAYEAVGGGLIDLGGEPRVLDDPGIANGGPNPIAAIDAGAFEFQGETVPLPGDFNGDGVIDFIDVLSLAFAIEAILP